ncbi:uncharacterized protein LOC128290554 [Gossypium arboreum]|uniref:uncharacterized protein LOC128290554 n=1 Tax=Gossypium arboreum TaxID=29729 RepID=UPI0022F1B3DB|nr:uncharacterized protein LOC128290554 [Gossypium arboreum]
MVDKAKTDVISSLPYPTTVKEIRSFLGHTGFYRRFIRDFSKILRPLCNLLQKDKEYKFDQACKDAYDTLKQKLVSVPIVQLPNWDYPFGPMCDVSDQSIGAVIRNFAKFLRKDTMSRKKTRSSKTTPILIDEKVKERFDSIFKHQPIMPENFFNLKSNDLMVVPIPFRKKINALKWEQFGDTRSLPDDELVREFYVSLTMQEATEVIV